jgi:hypothetical protein
MLKITSGISEATWTYMMECVIIGQSPSLSFKKRPILSMTLMAPGGPIVEHTTHATYITYYLLLHYIVFLNSHTGHFA